MIWLKGDQIVQTYRETVRIGQIELRLLGDDVHSGAFSHEFYVDRLVGLDPDNELIACDVGGRGAAPIALLVNFAEDIEGEVLELDTHFGLSFVEGCNSGSSGVNTEQVESTKSTPSCGMG